MGKFVLLVLVVPLPVIQTLYLDVLHAQLVLLCVALLKDFPLFGKQSSRSNLKKYSFSNFFFFFLI